MDLDVFVHSHRVEWDRLDHPRAGGRRLTGAEADELVDLYQCTATHPSLIPSSPPDPLLVGLILPHGLLELTAVFVAVGTGLRLGWTVIDPGPHPSRRAWPAWHWCCSFPG
ncbi:hypothetical protein AMK30_25660 [Streptomyces sp. CB02460]|nr:hypothetical protein AMK30_25660 [Streptomyces sp. CB02460]